MPILRYRRGLAVPLLAVLLALAAPALAAPEFTATYKVADAQPSGDAVHITFSFSLRSPQPSDVTVEAIKLGNTAASDMAYASFPGGTLKAGGELTGSAGATVPKKVYKKWQAGEPAALFVRTTSDAGGTVWTRVDAAAAAPLK
ncbi:MAG TPA: hypothetical protein VMQ62_06040 [Dongiaceae bacterium]|nr:hypothetical protein [Dongiaceae bacterium]